MNGWEDVSRWYAGGHSVGSRLAVGWLAGDWSAGSYQVFGNWLIGSWLAGHQVICMRSTVNCQAIANCWAGDRRSSI